MGDVEDEKSAFYSDFKSNSEFVALAINMSPWVNNLVQFFSGFYSFPPLKFFFTVKMNCFMGGPFLKLKRVVDSSTKGNNHQALKLNYCI